MAETSRRYNLGNKLDLDQILAEAQTRWLRPLEICEILQHHQKFQIAPEPPNKPPSGSLFLFDRKVLRYFRKDGHNWRKKRDGKTVKEAHEKLKAGSVDVLHCYYAHGEENENFQRRVYWMLEENQMHIVLVHYLEVKGNKTSFSFPSDSKTASPVSSSCGNSAQTSDYDDIESEPHQANSAYRTFPELSQSEIVENQMNTGAFNPNYHISSPNNQYAFRGNQPAVPELNFIPLAQDYGGRDYNSSGLNFELDLISRRGDAKQSPSFGPPVSSIQNNTLEAIPKQGSMILGQRSSDKLNKNHEIAAEEDSPYIPKWSMEQNLHIHSSYGRFNEPNSHYITALEPLDTHLAQKDGHPLQNDLQMQQLLDVEFGSLVKSFLENDLTEDGTLDQPSVAKQPLLESSRADSFNRWMSKELGEVDDSHIKSSSRFYWSAAESERVVDEASISPQLDLDAYLLSPSLAQDQLFSIIDFSPNWAYASSKAKVLITGTFLKNQQDVRKFKWSCMFGEMEVPAEVLREGVLLCCAPIHAAGRVPFYVTLSNRLACSEVREFEFQVDPLQDSNMANRTISDMFLHIRLGKLLSLESVSLYSCDSEKPCRDGKTSSPTKEDDDEWVKIVSITSEEEFSPGNAKELLLQRMLKEKLHAWLLQKVIEGGKGPTVLDEEGQGVLHLAAALGYDWAFEPTITSGVSINFRDVNGWTALHWAAFCGQERTVGVLVSLGAAPGLLTDPSPKFPAGRTPADLGSSNGHKGIAGYLAECSLTTHLSTLTVKDRKETEFPETSRVKAIQAITERSPTPINSVDVPDVSLKDSLTAVCNATQAAARIHQVLRVQSFQKKQFTEISDDKIRMSDERALSLISMKKNRQGQHDEPVTAAAIRIQNKFRGWKGRKEFLLTRQRIVMIQAHVRGHQVRKHYKSIVWSVGIVEKVVLRWRRKGNGFRGFRKEALPGVPTTSTPSKEDDYDFVKDGKKQTEERVQKALNRVKSMVQYPEARDQYRRLLTVVTEIHESKVVSDMDQNTSEEAVYDDDDMFDLEALIGDDNFMSTLR